MIRTFKEVPCKACNGTGRIKQKNDLFSSYSGADGPRGNNEKDAILAWNTREHEK